MFHAEKDLGGQVWRYINNAYSKIKAEIDLVRRTSGPKPRDKTKEELDDLRKELPDILKYADELEEYSRQIKKYLGYSGYNVEETTALLEDILAKMLSIAIAVNRTKLRKAILNFQKNLDRTLTYLSNFYTELERRAVEAGIDKEIVFAMYELRRHEDIKTKNAVSDALLESIGYNGDVFDKAYEICHETLASSKRASSLVENLNGRIRVILLGKKHVPDGLYSLKAVFWAPIRFTAAA